MRSNTFTAAAMVTMASTVLADFAIWTTGLATAGDPSGPIESALFVPYLDSGIACSDLESEDILRYASFNDVTPSSGGVSCDGCQRGTDFDRFEYWDSETNNANAIFSETFGYVTLRPEEGSDDWYFEYLDPDREVGGVVTNSRCVRATGEFTCSIAVATRTGAKLFDCFTSIEVIPRD